MPASTVIIPRNNYLRRTQRVRRGRSMRISRPIGVRYNGEYKLNRTIALNLQVGTAGVGWRIGASDFPSFAMVFDPTGLTIFGSAVQFNNYPLTNAAELSALWERIRIDKVELTFAPTFDQAEGIATGFSAVPQYAICNDVNNAAAGTSLGEILQHPDCKHVSTGDQFKWTVKPKYQRQVYYSAISSSYEPATGFVNSDTAIPHYSVHVGLLNQAILSANTSMLVTAKYFMTLRNVK